MTEEWSERLVCDAISKVAEGAQDEVITDFHIAAYSDSGEVSIHDDNGEVLARCVLEGMEEKSGDDFRRIVGKQLHQTLAKMDAAKSFDQLNLFRPFSFVLMDDDHEPVEDLYVVDSDNVVVSGELLKNLDSELTDFLNHLLEQ